MVASARGDVTGDGIPDTVYLTGVKTSDSPFIQNYSFNKDGQQVGLYLFLLNLTQVIILQFLGDFTGDGIKTFYWYYIRGQWRHHVLLYLLRCRKHS